MRLPLVNEMQQSYTKWQLFSVISINLFSRNWSETLGGYDLVNVNVHVGFSSICLNLIYLILVTTFKLYLSFGLRDVWFNSCTCNAAAVCGYSINAAPHHIDSIFNV